MAENKKTLAIETANENGNAAITERLDNVAERVSEAQKATDAVAKEQKQRLAEQEQSTELLQKEEEERRAQAQEAAKSVADRRAAALDYTENYRQNQKLEKAARSTVSKAKQERMAAEAEAKAKAEREAEEALQREREELMARRARSSALLKKVENDSETEAPAAKPAAARPAQKAMPKRESAPEVKAEAPEEAKPAQEAPVAESAPETAVLQAEPAAVEASKQEAAQDEAPAILESEPAPTEEAQSTPAADDAASAMEAPEASVEAEISATNNNEVLEESAPAAQDEKRAYAASVAKMVDEDIQRVIAEEAERAKALEEKMLKARIAGMMPAHLIPDSLRLFKPEETKQEAPAQAEEPVAVAPVEASASAEIADGNFNSAMQKLEDAVAAALGRIEGMAARAEEANARLERSASAQQEASEAEAPADGEQTLEQIADAAVAKDDYNDEALPEAFGEKPFTKKELRRYLKKTKADIAEKQQELYETRKEPGETNEELTERRLEREAAVLGAQFGAMALLASKGHKAEAERFSKDAEKGVSRYNKAVDKYNKKSEEKLSRLPEDIVSQILVDRRLPENVPFGSTTTELNSDAPDYAVVGGMLSDNGQLQAFPSESALSEPEAFGDESKQALNRAQSKALRKEMQKEMLLHAMIWNPDTEKKVKKKVKADAAAQGERDAQQSGKKKDKKDKSRKNTLAQYESSLAKNESDAKEAANGAATESTDKSALLTTVTDDAFLKNPQERGAYYDKRRAMLDAKREEIATLNYHNRNLPQNVRDEVAAAQQLDLIRDELGLLCLMNRYPDDARATACMQSATKDIEEYNRLAGRLTAGGKETAPLSTVLPAQALAQGEEMPSAAWNQLNRAVETGGKITPPTKKEKRRGFERVLEDAALIAAIKKDEKKAAKDTAAPQAEESVSSRMAYDEDELASEAAPIGTHLSGESEEKASADASAEYYAIAADPLHSNIGDRELRKAADAYVSEMEIEADAEAPEEERRLRLMYAATDAMEKSQSLPAESKEEMLAVAKQAAENSEDKAQQKRLSRMAEKAARKEAKRADRALDADKKNLALLERNRDMAEARALAAEQEAADAAERASAFNEGLINEKSSEAYSEALNANAAAESARLTADALAAEYERKKEEAIGRQEAKMAMLAFAATASTDYNKSKGMPLSDSDKRKLDAAIEGAESRLARAQKASGEADEKLLALTEKKASNGRVAAARDAAVKNKALADDAEKKLNALLATKDALEKSKALGRKEKAELVALAVAASERDSDKLQARLQSRVAAAARKEEKAALRFEKSYESSLDRYEKRMAETEAEAHIRANAAQKAKEKADKLSEKKAHKNELNKAYEQALLEESRAAEARAEADSVKAQRDIEENHVEAYRAAGAAMLALLAALALQDNKKKENKQTAVVLRETRKLDNAISDAGIQLAQAEEACIAAAKNEVALLESESADEAAVDAARKAYLEARQGVERADSKKEMLEKAKLATEKSKALKDEQKAEIMALAVELSADDKESRKADLLNKKLEKAVEKETALEKKLAEAIEDREEALETERLSAEAKAKAAEDAARVARRDADRLERHRANEKVQKKALKAALLAEAKAEKERKAAEELKAKKLAEEEKGEQNKEASVAMLAFAGAFAAHESMKNRKGDRIPAAVLGGAARNEFIGNEITEAERQYEQALLKEEAARAKLNALEREKAQKRDRKTALLAVGLAEEETIRAERRLETLKTAKHATEKSKELSPEEKNEMLVLAAAAGMTAKRDKAAQKKQKKSAKAVKKEALAEKRAAERTQSDLRDWDKRVAQTEAKALVSEECMVEAKKNAKAARLEKRNKKALERAYKDALVSEYKAEKAKRKAEFARAEKKAKRDESADRAAERMEAEAAMLAFAAAMAAENKRIKRTKNARLREDTIAQSKQELAAKRAIAAEAKAVEQSELEKRSVREAELYARALEEKAMRSEQKALFLAPKKGKTKEKLKAYEEALFDRAEANEARANADKLQSEDAPAAIVALPLGPKERKLQAELDRATEKQKKAQKRLDAHARYADKVARHGSKAQKRKYAAETEKLEKRLEKAELAKEKAQQKLDARLNPSTEGKRKHAEKPSAARKQSREDARLQRKQQKAALKSEKKALKDEFKRYKMAAKVRKTDLNAMRKAALSGRLQNERLVRKLEYERRLAEKKQIADEKAWDALEKRDEALALHTSYMSLLELDRRDRERLKANAEEKKKAEEAANAAPAPEALAPNPVLPRLMTKKERRARNRAFKKCDMRTLDMRYEAAIVEAKRDLELALNDLSCTPANAKRIKLETRDRLWKLAARKRRAMKAERLDNYRYFFCLRKSRIKPKNHRVDRAELARMYEKLTQLLEERDSINKQLQSVYLYDCYKVYGRVNTPWHKAFMREKKRWHKRLRGELRTIDSMNLSRRDKQRLRADLDCVATAHADIVETKCRIQRQKLKGKAKRLQKQEIKAMKRDARRAHKHMKRKMSIAAFKADKRDFWYVSMISLAITLSLICIGVLTWHWFGDKIVGFMNANFPGVVSKLKSLLK